MPSYVLSLYENWLIFYKQAFVCNWIFPLKKWEVVVHSLSRVRLFATLWTATLQASLSVSISWSLLKLMSFELGMPSSHLFLCCPLLLLPSVFPSIRFFSNELTFASGGQHIGASASVLPMNIQDWFPLGLTAFYLLAFQETLESLLQHHSSKASVFRCLSFLMVQLSHPYIDYWKNIVLTRWSLVDKVMSLTF